MIKPLYDDQINSFKWVKHADYIYSNLPDGHDPWETEALELNPNLKKYYDKKDLPKKATIFINGHHSVPDFFTKSMG